MPLISFIVTLPATQAPVTVEDFATEGETPGGGEVFSSEGGTLYIKNTGSNNALLGHAANPLFPLAPADPPLVIQCNPNDKLSAQAATAVAGQLTVVKVVK